MKEKKEIIQTKDVFLLELKDVVIAEGFNVREDYGDMHELMWSIIHNGIKSPLTGYKRGDKYVVTDGHRRHRAVQMALENQGVDIKIPLLPDGKGYSEEQRVLDMVIANSGKQLTMLEEASVYGRLLNYGWTEHKIAEKACKSLTHINNCFILNSVPEIVKEDIRKGNVSPTNVIELMRKEKDGEAVKEILSVIKDNLTEDRSIKRADINKVIKDKPIVKVVPDLEEIYKIAEGRNRKWAVDGAEISLQTLAGVIAYCRNQIDAAELTDLIVPEKATVVN